MGDKALIIHPVFPERSLKNKSSGFRSTEDQIEEIEALVKAIDLQSIHTESIKIARMSPSHLLGKGTVQRLHAIIAEIAPDIVIVNYALSPVQQRNLEKDLNAKVIDRTGLILEIFGERAQTKEGRIQVELAALEYQKSRLVRSWTHLERQRGGAGFMGGPGETQIELDRRIIADKIVRLKKQLEEVKKTRDLGKKARERVPFPIIALIGYTNAGKSTLFNTLTGAEVFAKDLLFATLDPTMRKMALPDGQNVILADTVGFISDLPTSLIAAFRSTLEQVEYADVILHVRDIAREDSEAQKRDVMSVMDSLGVNCETDTRVIEVWNKIDSLPPEEKAKLLTRAERQDSILAISARSGEGLSRLLELIASRLAKTRQTFSFRVPHIKGNAIAWLYNHGEVLERQEEEENSVISMMMTEENVQKFAHHFGLKPLMPRKGKHAN